MGIWISTNLHDNFLGKEYVMVPRNTVTTEAAYQQALRNADADPSATQIAALAKAGVGLGKKTVTIALDLENRDLYLHRPLPDSVLSTLYAECRKIAKTG